MKLDNRLKTIADFVQRDKIVGDIGSDHGYLMTYLVEEKIIKSGIASDINEGPVKNCKETIKLSGLEDAIDVRLGGGFIPYKKNEIHTAVLAGMGGELIRDIFLEKQDVVKTVKRFILQPMTGQDVLRAWLIQNKFSIITEKIAQDAERFYEIMVVEHGESHILRPDHLKHISMDAPLLMEIGYATIVDECYSGFISKKIEKYETIIEKIKKNATKTHAKLQIAETNLEMLKEVKSCIQIQVK